MERTRKDYRRASFGTESGQCHAVLPSYQWRGGELTLSNYLLLLYRKRASIQFRTRLLRLTRRW